MATGLTAISIMDFLLMDLLPRTVWLLSLCPLLRRLGLFHIGR